MKKKHSLSYKMCVLKLNIEFWYYFHFWEVKECWYRLVSVSFTNTLTFDTKYWYCYWWIRWADTIIDISIAEAQAPILYRYQYRWKSSTDTSIGIEEITWYRPWLIR